MQNGHLPGEGGKQGRERVSPAGSGRYPPRLIPTSPACPRPPSRLRDPTCPLPNPALPPPGDPRWLCCRQSHPLACSGGAGWGGGGLLAAPADASPQEGEQSQCRVGGGRPAKLFSPPGTPARPLGALPASHQPRPRAHPQDLPSRWEQHKESTFHAPHQAHAERLRVLKNSL